MARVAVFYHFLYPDPVVSSVHLSELCAGLVERGWQVEGHACTQSYNGRAVYPPASNWKGVAIHRAWRPNWKQSSGTGRILNAMWMVGCWSLLAVSIRNAPDVIVMGTDPILSIVMAPVWRLLRPRTKIVHWCFDLYPEAAYSDGVLRRGGLLSRLIEALLRPSYAACDLVVDIGSCMRDLLLKHRPEMQTATLVPWALSEPALPLETPKDAHREIFGESRLALMYSGTLGRAHSYDTLLDLMRQLRGDSAHLAFSVKGNREDHLRAAVSAEQDPNISFVPFAPADKLEERLATADVHVVSLREEWTGTVVPSKFFGALAVGRPILFCGSRESAIARWIQEFEVGWVLSGGDTARVAEALRAFAGDDAAKQAMRVRCHRVYQEQFSREAVIDAWNRELHALLPAVRHVELPVSA